MWTIAEGRILQSGFVRPISKSAVIVLAIISQDYLALVSCGIPLLALRTSLMYFRICETHKGHKRTKDYLIYNLFNCHFDIRFVCKSKNIHKNFVYQLFKHNTFFDDYYTKYFGLIIIYKRYHLSSCENSCKKDHIY